jgi:hypothetical protein
LVAEVERDVGDALKAREERLASLHLLPDE